MKQTDQEIKIQRMDLFHIRFYEKSWFHGSFRGLHYRIEGIQSGDDPKQLRVTTWPGPYNFDHTDDALKETALFAFSDQGLDEITDYLNQYYKDHRKELPPSTIS